jgi:hypothetical protein
VYKIRSNWEIFLNHSLMMILRLEPHFYRKKHPTHDDVLLLIEVSDTTVRYDRNVKKQLYAHYSIIEYLVSEFSR